MNDNIFQIENAIFINLPSDLHKVTEGIRESFAYLLGLNELDLFYKGLSQNDKSKISDNVNKLKEELQNIEDDLSKQSNGKQFASFSDDKKLKEIIKQYFFLKEKVDKFQLEILNDFINIFSESLKKITENKKYLEQFYAQIYASLLIKSAFLHSSSENKKITYIILNEYNDKFDKSLNPFETYCNVEVYDYSFSLQRDRIRFQHIYDQLFNLIFSIPEIDNKKNIDELIVKQYSLNRQMVILTYIIGFLTIVMTILGIIQIINMK